MAARRKFPDVFKTGWKVHLMSSAYFNHAVCGLVIPGDPAARLSDDPNKVTCLKCEEYFAPARGMTTPSA